MKKLLNKLSSSGNTSLREDSTHSDEEHLDAHYRKASALPADTRDTSQEIKIKKSFSSSGSIGKGNKEFADFSSPKKSSNGIKVHKDKETNDKEKLNESDDKLKKSGSVGRRKKSISKSSEVKPESMRSPSLKSIFASSYEQQRDTGILAAEESSSDEEDAVPRSRGNSMHDDEEFYTTTPIRVPSAPGRMAVSPVPMNATPPSNATPPKSAMRATSPRPELTPTSAFSPYSSPHHAQVLAYSPPSPYRGAPSPSAQVPSLPRSVSSPNPSSSKNVIAADDFDLRFGVAQSVRNDAESDETALGSEFSRDHSESATDDVEMIDDNGEATNQKGKSGLFSFGNNKAKKLK